jgi:glyoxylase I family protein
MNDHPLQIIGLDHIVLRANDPDRLIAFYRDVLGCVVERVLEDYGLTQLRAGGSLIDIVAVDGVLGALGGAGPSAEGANLAHFCLQVAADEASIRDYLAAWDIHVDAFRERYGATGFGQSCYIHDPENNAIELKIIRKTA